MPRRSAEIELPLAALNGASKTWVGNISNIWDVNGANNWTNSGSGDNKFLNLDSVTLDDTASGSHSLVLAANVTPNAITVNSTSADPPKASRRI